MSKNIINKKKSIEIYKNYKINKNRKQRNRTWIADKSGKNYSLKNSVNY